jgi:hypothetical protein
MPHDVVCHRTRSAVLVQVLLARRRSARTYSCPLWPTRPVQPRLFSEAQTPPCSHPHPAQWGGGGRAPHLHEAATASPNSSVSLPLLACPNAAAGPPCAFALVLPALALATAGLQRNPAGRVQAWCRPGMKKCCMLGRLQLAPHQGKAQSVLRDRFHPCPPLCLGPETPAAYAHPWSPSHLSSELRCSLEALGAPCGASIPASVRAPALANVLAPPPPAASPLSLRTSVVQGALRMSSSLTLPSLVRP